MKKTLLALPLLLALTACGGGATSEAPAEEPTPGPIKAVEPNADGFYEQQVELRDGRVVTCILYAEFRQAGLSCDWAQAPAPPR